MMAQKEFDQKNVVSKFPASLQKFLFADETDVVCLYVSADVWQAINDAAVTLGYHWVSGNGDRAGHWTKEA
jgi:hypothetical protein